MSEIFIYLWVNLENYVNDWVDYVESVEVEEKVAAVEEDFEKLAKELQDASPLEIMDKALEKFGNDIAIAFR